MVAFLRQLCYHRHIFWAAVSLVDCLSLAQRDLEIDVVVHHDIGACRVFVFLVGYSILLPWHSLALPSTAAWSCIIARYECYKKLSPNRDVVLLLIDASFLTFIDFTSTDWTGNYNLHLHGQPDLYPLSFPLGLTPRHHFRYIARAKSLLQL